MTPQERLERAKSARFVLENPAYVEAVAKIATDIRTLRLALPPRDIEGGQRLIHMEQAVEKAKRLMEAYLQDGEAARKELEKAAEPNPVVRIGRRIRRG